jgi:hypothetical protein
VCTPYASYASRDSATPAITAQDIAFLAVATVAALIAFAIRDLDRLRRVLLGATGVMLVGLPAMRLATGGPGWSAAWNTGIDTVPIVDIALLAFGFICLWAARGRQARTGEVSEAPAAVSTEPHSA